MAHASRVLLKIDYTEKNGTILTKEDENARGHCMTADRIAAGTIDKAFGLVVSKVSPTEAVADVRIEICAR